MFGRRVSLRDLVRNQHEEFTAYQERRDEEWRQRDAEFREESRLRAEEAELRAEEAKLRAEESRQREERLKRLEEETREYNREMLLRNEKVYKAVIAEVEEGRRQIQANTKAVLSVLDRLQDSGGAAAA
jgi:hypothetical protein